MGYRARLGKIAKTEKAKFDGLNYEEAFNIEEDLYYPPAHTQIYELGKHVNFANQSGKSEPFYSFDIYDECKSEFCILNKEGLEFIIDEYHKIIKGYFNDMKPEEFEGYIRSKRGEWDNKFNLKPYSIDTNKEFIGSWKYEYAIFTLVEIYRSFDWEDDYLIYSAW